MLAELISKINNFFWADCIKFNLNNGNQIGFSFLCILLISVGLYFFVRTKFLPIKFSPDMFRQVKSSLKIKNKNSVSGLQTVIISTASRVGMGNLLGVAAAISGGGAGAVFWMWLSALINSSTAFIESVLAQLHKKEDKLYGGYKGGPAYYIHDFFVDKLKFKRKNLISILFALSGLICWCGISQVVGNSVSSVFQDAFNIPGIISASILFIFGAVIVLRRDTTVRVLNFIVPAMAFVYLFITFLIMIINLNKIPMVISNIFSQAFGFKQIIFGGVGIAITEGVKRGIFSNEAGSGSAPCAAATAESKKPIEIGFLQVFGVLVDTIVCTCTAMLILLTPEKIINKLNGMELLQKALRYHLGYFGIIFIAVILFLFSFSTFLGILFYARSNVSYLAGENWWSQNVFKIIALIMLFCGGIYNYNIVWMLADVGIALMTFLNLIMIVFLRREAFDVLKNYCAERKNSSKK